MDLKKQRGQFFTTRDRVLDVLTSLIHNTGDIFEPSAGSGHIIKSIEQSYTNIYSCEIDGDKVRDKVCQSQICIDNFFNYIKRNKKYSTVIGNPPFVKLKNVEKETIKLLPEKIRSNGNLYYYFIKYGISVLEHSGELIFIVPKEWLYNTSSQFLRNYLQEIGGFTHFIDCGEEKLFDDADVPSLCIFRFEVGYRGKVKYYNNIDSYNYGNFEYRNTQYGNTITFTNRESKINKISDFFEVKVGLVSGNENIFKIIGDHNFEEVGIKNMISTDKNYHEYLFLESYNNIDEIPPQIREYLLSNKDKLMSRKIKKFTSKNWWKYGAIRNIEIMMSDRKRIYGLMKTRNEYPFWVGDPNSLFSGGVFALFLKDGVNLDLYKVVDYLNSIEFKTIMSESNLYTNNKVSITPTAFSSLPFDII